MDKKNLTRRQFLRQAGGATGGAAMGAGAAAGMVAPGLSWAAELENAPAVDRKQLVAALGDTIIPTADGYPGYRRLEQYGITDEVMKGLGGITQQEANLFNAAAGEFQGSGFLELDEAGRSAFLEQVVASFPEGTFGQGTETMKPTGEPLETKLDAAAVRTLQKVFQTTRTRVMVVFYQNFPENRVSRDGEGIPVVPGGDLHQIINPNTARVETGWDIANFPGPMSWEEEQERRERYKQIHWHED